LEQTPVQVRPQAKTLRRNPGNAIKVFLFVGLFANGVAAMAQSARTDSSRPQVHPVRSVLRLETYQNTPVSQVLDTLCQQEKVDCTGIELLSNHMIPAMVREGNFLELVGYLVDGTEVNFDYVRGTPGSPSRLVLLARSPGGVEPQQTLDAHTENASDNVIEAAVSAMTAEFGDVTRAPNFAAQATAAAGDGQQLLRPQSADDAAAQKAAEMMYGGGRTTEVIPSAYLPFPDQDGHPIPAKPVNSTSPSYLPFPDQFGNPIPAVPGKSGSPFPAGGESKAQQ
jgi:hypothetical protein